MKLSTEEKELFDLALDSSDEALLNALGEALADKELGISLPSPEEIREYATSKKGTELFV